MSFAPMSPQGIAFHLADHDLASRWSAEMRPFGLRWAVMADAEEYEELGEVHLRGVQDVLWFIYRANGSAVDCYVVVSVRHGQATRFTSLADALEFVRKSEVEEWSSSADMSEA